MCGRFTLTIDPGELQDLIPGLVVPGDIRPRFNIAPSQPIAVLPNTGNNTLDFYVWGLIPSWAKDPAIGNRMINARSETLAEKPSFRSAFRRKRCLIFADGFYEWQQAEAGKPKQPMYVCMKDQKPFAFAGLWEMWFAPDGSEVRSCTIITTEPNDLMKNIHNRMPVILPSSSYPLWIDPNEQPPERFKELLIPFPAEAMKAYPVSRFVNSPNNDSPECVKPLEN
jgi:putative SOS response-associated peptidase YedK